MLLSKNGAVFPMGESFWVYMLGLSERKAVGRTILRDGSDRKLVLRVLLSKVWCIRKWGRRYVEEWRRLRRESVNMEGV